MIIGFHLTWTTYGHWFPNDPRGSWSEEVWKPQLAHIRSLDSEHKVTHPRSVSKSLLQEFMDRSRANLRWNSVQLSKLEIAIASDAFSEVISAIALGVCACAILPNHVHLVIERHNDPYERIVSRLKGRSAQWIRES